MLQTCVGLRRMWIKKRTIHKWINQDKQERERGERGKGGFSKRCRKKVMEEEKIEEIKEHTIFKYLPNLII